MLLSTDRTSDSASHLDSSAAANQIAAALSLKTSLATNAQKHNAKLANEPAPEKLPAIADMQHSAEVVRVTEQNGDGGNGGQGTATAYSEPHLQLSTPSGIAALTPANAIVSAGATSTFTAGQDLNFASQGGWYHGVKAGISLFTYGKASDAKKPSQETGIRLHAASGTVSTQSQSDATRLTADKMVTVASVTKSVSVAAKEHVLLTAQGAFLKIVGGDIQLHGPGKVEFKAGKKELTGPLTSTAVLPSLPKAENLANFVEINHHWPDLTPVAGGAYRAVFADGTSTEGTLDSKGFARLEKIPPGPVQVYFGEDPKPFERELISDAGNTTFETVQQELEKLGYVLDMDDIEAWLDAMSGRIS